MRYKLQQNAQSTRCGQFLWLLVPVLVGSALYDKHETGLACIARAKPYKM